jgi:hypothetical protein
MYKIAAYMGSLSLERGLVEELSNWPICPGLVPGSKMGNRVETWSQDR